MSTSTEASVTWAQALSWRMERQLLDPVGSESVAGVVRRLGAVLSMDESLAELAVRTRRTTSRAGRARGGPGRRRGDQGVRVPRVDALPLAGGGRDLPRPPGGRPAVGAGELGGVLPARPGGLARLPGRGPRRAERRAADRRRARRGADAPPRVPAPEAGLRRGRGHPDQAADLAGGHELRPAARRAAHVPAPRRQPEVARHPRPRRRRPAGPSPPTCARYGPATLDHLHYWLVDGLSAGRRRLEAWFSELGDRLVAVDVEGTAGVRRARGRRRPRGCASVRGGAVPSRARPVGDRSRHQGHPRHPGLPTRPDDPQGQPGGRRRRGVRHLGATR